MIEKATDRTHIYGRQTKTPDDWIQFPHTGFGADKNFKN
jgi:hypothetical protein